MNDNVNNNIDKDDMEYQKIVFCTEDGEEEFYVLEQTILGGVNYVLVTDDLDSDDAGFLILKETQDEDDEDFIYYDLVDDDAELKSIVAIFNELVDDFDLEV